MLGIIILIYSLEAHALRPISHLATIQVHRKDPEPMDAINQFRAEKCADRPNPTEHEECQEFMKKACNPGGADGKEGKQAQMNNEDGEISTGKGYCKKFFNAEKKKKEEEEKKKAEEEEKKKAEGEKKEGEEEGQKEAEGEPKDADETKEDPNSASHDGKSSEKSAEEAWGSTEGDKLPEQGFHGVKVAHDNGKTTVGDFSKEYGPDGISHDYKKICAKHPNSFWCKAKGYSTASMITVAPLLFAMILIS